ncbi:MAG: Ig-like domain-containing protein [Candidatus Ornithospirochaeta sp.]|nr:Ig-like domain-containing protein [Candidatus Ornithospirochaeta sp.]
MKKNTILIAVMALLLIFSCDMNPVDGETTTSLSVTVSDAELNERTLLPNAAVVPDNYKARLLQNGEEKYSAVSASGTILFGSVRIGDYDIVVDGYKGSTLVSSGTSSISLSANGENTATIALKLLTQGEGLTGSIEVKFDWSAVVNSNGYFKDMYDKGQFSFELYERKTVDGKGVDTKIGNTQTAPANATSYIFRQDGIPVSNGFLGIFKMKVGNDLVMEFGPSSFQIYSGHVSRPDANDASLFTITSSNAPTYSNEVAFSVDYGEDPETQLKVDATVRGTKNNLLYHSVILTLSDPSNSSNTVTETIDTTSLADDVRTISHTFRGLTTGHEYIISAKAITVREKPTPVSTISMKTKRLVTGISIPTQLPQSFLTYNDKFLLSAAVEPSDATIKDVEWTVSDREVLTVSQDAGQAYFYAKKPGRATITAKALDPMRDGNYATATTGVVTVKLSQPDTPTVEKDNYASTKQTYLLVHWPIVNYAESYDIYRSVNNGEYVLLQSGFADSEYRDSDINAGDTYSYKVIAKAPTLAVNEFDPTSTMSVASNSVAPLQPTITLVQPTISNFRLQIVDGQGVVPSDITVTPDHSVTLQLPAVEGLSSYNWYVNGILVKANSNTVELTAAMPQVQDYEADANSLMVSATDANGRIYSSTIYFRVVTVLDTGVELTIDDAISTKASNVKLAAEVLPKDATIKSLTYHSDNEDVATIDGSGNITVKAYGTVTFTATTTSGKTNSRTVIFYEPIDKHDQIINIVANVLKTHITAANSQFGGDWWEGSANEYNGKDDNGNSNIYIKSSSRTSQSAGYVEIKDGYTVNRDNYGPFVLKTSINLQTWAKDPFSGYLYNDPLESVADNGVGEIEVTLPYNQGTAKISFPQELHVINNTGTYRVSLNGSDKDYAYSSYPVL